MSKNLRGEILGRVGRAIDSLPHWIFNRWGVMAIDGVVSAIAMRLAWQLRFDFEVPPRYVTTMLIAVVAVLLIRPACLWLLGAYRTVWRYFNLGDAITLSVAAAPPTVLMLLFRGVGIHSVAAVPLSVILIDYGIFLLFTVVLRAVRRYLFEASLGLRSSKRTLLIGSAEGLASALRQISFHAEIHVIRVLSTDQTLYGSRIAGFPITGGPERLAKYLASEDIHLVLIADADSDTVAAAVSTATEFGLEVSLMPLAADIVRGDVRFAGNPKPELALREPVQITSKPHSAVVETFGGRSVVVTGAGGSIGSELCRQVSHLPVKELILLDHDENGIFRMHGELTVHPKTEVVPIVADIRDRKHISSIFSRHKPDIVLHAAAYKHVPVMEFNCSEAVLNNIVGTRNIAEAAIESGAERFLMISTDKAVNPSSVMGATKRAAELTVQHLALRQSNNGNRTRCACVRFGNVMSSNGSVVPIFLRQIAVGGPVTITHEEMTRYFMTIPSAVQLALQATTLGADGEIYILDMGDPIKITTLARRLIEMSGLRPGQDIEIRVVGTRPGEKLHEQLWSDSAKVSPTTFPSVLRIEPAPPSVEFASQVSALEMAAQARNDRGARAVLLQMPINYAEIKEAAIA
jgi:FlaA1/EpsC-like NDP-sugar epimerase